MAPGLHEVPAGCGRTANQIREGGGALQPIDLARCVVDSLVDQQARDVVLLDVGGLTLIADYFVIASAPTERQTRSLIESVTETCRNQLDARPARIEGEPSDGWVLMDYGSTIVHLFAPEARQYYDLEGLWRESRLVVRVQ